MINSINDFIEYLRGGCFKNLSSKSSSNVREIAIKINDLRK